MPEPIHYFVVPEPNAFPCSCGEWREGHSWTTRPQGVTCPKCRELLLRADHPADEERTFPTA